MNQHEGYPEGYAKVTLMVSPGLETIYCLGDSASRMSDSEDDFSPTYDQLMQRLLQRHKMITLLQWLEKEFCGTQHGELLTQWLKEIELGQTRASQSKAKG